MLRVDSMSQDLMKNDGVAVADWKSPELIPDDEDPDAFLADESANDSSAC